MKPIDTNFIALRSVNSVDANSKKFVVMFNIGRILLKMSVQKIVMNTSIHTFLRYRDSSAYFEIHLSNFERFLPLHFRNVSS